VALNLLSYSKSWTETDGSSERYFTTTEDDESKVRADMQLLYDEIQAWANELIEKLDDCSNIGMGEASILQATNVKAALIELKNIITAGTVPDYTLGIEKMKRKSEEGVAAVDTDNIADEAITTDLIEDSAVTGAKIASKTITKGKLAEYEDADSNNAPVGTKNIQNGAVTNNKIKNYSLTHDKLATVNNPDGAAVDTNNLVDKCVTADKIADTTITNAQISSTANIAPSKIADGIPLSKLESGYTIPVANGGTGKTTQETVTLDVTFKDGTTGSYNLVVV